MTGRVVDRQVTQCHICREWVWVSCAVCPGCNRSLTTPTPAARTRRRRDAVAAGQRGGAT